MKKNQLFLILIVCTSIWACKKEIEVNQQKDDAGNLTAEYEARTKDGAKQGKFIGYYTSGKKFEESTYVNNVLDGKRTLFYESGQIQAIENHVKGTFIGLYQSFFENGKKKEEGQYSNDAMNGEWKFYYPSGNIKEIINFVENEENGTFREFHKNGTLMTEGTYKDGDNEIGELKKYDATGQLIEKMNCELILMADMYISQCKSIWKAK